ncbi:MAG: EAL domain-containing protein, partial [Oscillospiraceae bacterium]
FGVTGFEDLFHRAMDGFFGLFTDGSVKSILFVFITNFLWFFGVHGSNVLEGVAQSIFHNPETIASTAPFLTKPAIDVFILMGGCGTTISLLVAILLFGKQKNNRSLAKMAAIPMLFNVNELMVFGLPIVFNAVFFIPFLLVPLVCVGTTALAITTGLVPPPMNQVEWVMPIFVNGYQATGSIRGALLQVVNILVGALIYRFFLVRYEVRTNERMLGNLATLVGELKKSEDAGEPLVLLELKGPVGGVSKMLAADLSHVMRRPDSLRLFYQPQYNSDGQCVGAEALLRWEHPICGMIYPPLLIGLAGEMGLLNALEREIFRIAAEDITAMHKENICPGSVSVNVTAATLKDPTFVAYLKELLAAHPDVKDTLCIELTEQMSFILSETVKDRLKAVHEMGIRFAVDDFSMGHTSVKYLQSNLFDVVKLDGSLVSDMMVNERSAEIVQSIVKMGQSMGFEVLAEYVETEAQRDKLKELGCHLYQGYLYSPAIPLAELRLVLYRDAPNHARCREGVL